MVLTRQQEKAIFAKKQQTQVRSPVTPVFFTTAQARDRKTSFTRGQLEKFGKEFSMDRNRRFVDVAQGKKGRIVVASVNKSRKLTRLQKLAVVGDIIAIAQKRKPTSPKVKFIDITTPKKLKAEVRRLKRTGEF